MIYKLISLILVLSIFIIFIIRIIVSLNIIKKLDKNVKNKYKEIGKLHYDRVNIILKVINKFNMDNNEIDNIIKVTNILLKNKDINIDIEYNVVLLNDFKLFLEHNYNNLKDKKGIINYLNKIKDIDKELKKYIFFYNESVNNYNNYYNKFNIILKIFNKKNYRSYK